LTINLEERLERLERLLDELAGQNVTVPVLVEGGMDRDALRELGLTGEVLLINIGKPLIDRIAAIGREHGELIVLTDWDRKGIELFKKLTRLAVSEGLKVVGEPWRRLRPLVQKDIQAVEDLPSLMRQLRAKRRARCDGPPAGPG
jgi:5S rRNA maturation endonuclease (ribonuclease M5)